MDKTEQFNLRISKSILSDLEFIERITEVPKTDWVRIYIAEAVKRDKNEHMHTLERNFMLGRINEEEFKRIAGCSPEDALKQRKEAYDKKMLEMMTDETKKKFARKALEEMNKK